MKPRMENAAIKPSGTIPFTKMAGTGNDFIVLDNRDGRFTGRECDFFAAICRRRLSVGADGVILLEKGEKAPVRMRYYNRDGREAEMCANGARCTAFFAVRKNLVHGSKFVLEASDGPHEAEVTADQVRLKLAVPRDFRSGMGIVRDKGFREGGFINTGVPHLVLFADDSMDMEQLDVDALALYYRRHPTFDRGTNVNFVKRTGTRTIRVRTFERGVEGETLSCGTGCVASALIASRTFGLESPILVETRGGGLSVEFNKNWMNILLTGPVRIVFEGVIFPEPRELT
jgi:diaminopimelate epimerase